MYFLLWQNSSLGCSTLLHTKTAINNLFKTVFRITMLRTATEAEINWFFKEQLTWYTLYSVYWIMIRSPCIMTGLLKTQCFWLKKWICFIEWHFRYVIANIQAYNHRQLNLQGPNKINSYAMKSPKTKVFFMSSNFLFSAISKQIDWKRWDLHHYLTNSK